jgi:hypothetical protein
MDHIHGYEGAHQLPGGTNERGKAALFGGDLGGPRSTTREGIIARIYLALEELRIGSDKAEELRKEALDVADELVELYQRKLVSRLREYRPKASTL